MKSLPASGSAAEGSASASLAELPSQLWSALERGSRIAEDSFHVAVFATSSSAGCSVRMMVLQQADSAERSLLCCSDWRAWKIRQIQLNPQVSWVFYDPRTRTQLRANGRATLHCGDDLARRFWQNIPTAQQFQYCSRFAPGTRITHPYAVGVSWQAAQGLTELEIQAGFANFAVIRTTVSEMDWLELNAPGHRRAEFAWDGQQFVGHWLAV